MSKKERLNLVEKILQTLTMPSKTSKCEELFAQFSVGFGGEKPTEEVVEELRKARKSNWEVTAW